MNSIKNSLLRDFAKYSSLNILGMIGLSCYILADTFFVSKALGATGLAALNLSIPIFNVVHGLGLMIGIGGATRFSILKSQNEDEKAQIAFSTSIKVGFWIGILLVIIGILGSERLALLFGADMVTLPYTNTYLITILVFSPFFILNNTLLAFVRNDHNPRLSMIAMLVGSFSNIILDYIFMFPLKMGMFGAAFATCLAPIISLCILSFHFVERKNLAALVKTKMLWSLVPDLFSLGLSALIIEISSGIVLITFNLVILGLEGNLGVAAYGIVANLALVVIAIFTGLAQGTQPLASKFYGLREHQSVNKLLKYAFVTSISIALIIYFSFFIFAESIVGIFNSEDHARVSEIAVTGLRIYSLGFFFAGINIIAAIFLGATEKARAAFSISIARGIIIIVPLVLMLSRIWNLYGVWLSFIIK